MALNTNIPRSSEKSCLKLTLPVPSLLVPTSYTKGGGESRPDPRANLKDRCPHEHKILYGIRGIFEHPRNVNVSYILINWLL